MAGSIFSIPSYVPDNTSGEWVQGYEVQSGTVISGNTDFYTWADIVGSPFLMNNNIIDPSGIAQGLPSDTVYRARPLRTVPYGNGTVDLDSAWSRPFKASTDLYDSVFTHMLLPALRFTYLGDNGMAQTNSTNIFETTGAGNGTFIFDGTSTRFPLQYVMNDDPITVLDDVYQLTYAPSGINPRLLTPWQDYQIHGRDGVLEFQTPPMPGDYARLDFRKCAFTNSDLLSAIASAVGAASQYGLNGYQVNQNYNLFQINQMFKYPDIIQIMCKLTIVRLREGLTEQAMRSTTSWRDGNSSVDPYPSRALEFLVTKSDLNETHIRREINTFIRGVTLPKSRGEFDAFWDLSQLTPLMTGMLRSMPGGAYGTLGAGLGLAQVPWYI